MVIQAFEFILIINVPNLKVGYVFYLEGHKFDFRFTELVILLFIKKRPSFQFCLIPQFDLVVIQCFKLYYVLNMFPCALKITHVTPRVSGSY